MNNLERSELFLWRNSILTLTLAVNLSITQYTMSFSSVALRCKISNEGTETEKRLATLLFDETLQVLSTFEMNQIASLSYENETCEQIFDLLEEVMRHPMEFTILAVQKSLFVAKHILIYGSEKCVNSCWALRSHVEQLGEFNTVLLTNQKEGLGSWWQSVKGGGVDKGFPVREAAQPFHKLLSDAPRIRQLRNDHADPNSLVPVGSNDRVAFVSDEIRHYMLQKRVEEQRLRLTRSNLKKSAGGFGSGFNAANGQSVVGAAHSMEEMMARADRETKKFSETGPVHFKPKQAQAVQPKQPAAAAAPVLDLLNFHAPTPAPFAPQVDFLGFGGSVSTPAPVIDIFALAPTSVDFLGGGGGDLLGGGAPSADLLGGDLFTTTTVPAVKEINDLMSLVTMSVPTHSGTANVGIAGMNTTNGLLSMTTPIPKEETAVPAITNSKPSVMASNVDRFAALDALSLPEGMTTASTILSAKEAENRILSFSSPPSVGKGAAFPTEAPPPPPMYSGDSDMAAMGGEAVTGGSMRGFAMMGAEAVTGGDAMMGGTSMGAGMPSYGMAPPPTDLPPMSPSQMPPPYEPTTLAVAEKFGDIGEEEDTGFLMGGTCGSGLEPTGAMPSAPPPPPPSW